MKVRLLNKSKNENPSYKTSGASGMDIQASLKKGILLKPQERVAVSTGLFLEIPENCEAQIRPRSGLALKRGITVLNTPGTIDSDYRGELLIILINHSGHNFKINNGDRIAQLVITKTERFSWETVNGLTETKRGSGGFGSTGK